MKGKSVVGRLDAKDRRFAVVGARFNSIFADRLVEGAVDALISHGALEKNVSVVRVPGSFEIPLAAEKLAKSGQFEAVIAVGVLIRGETDHYELVAKELAAGLSRAMAESGVPVTFGVVAAENMEQAMARSGAKAGNKGWEAAVAAIEMADLMAQLRELDS